MYFNQRRVLFKTNFAEQASKEVSKHTVLETETMNTLSTCVGIVLAMSVLVPFSLKAQTASTTDYDFLLSISEPERFDLYDRSVPKEGRNVVPVASPVSAEIDFSHPLPQLTEKAQGAKEGLTITEHLQLATAFRLRGDYVQAVPHYAQIVKLSKQPIHAFFYAQALRATGQDLLADLYEARYTAGEGGSLEELPEPISAHSGVPVMIHGRVNNLYDGKPMASVEVRMVNRCTEEELVTTTDANGNFRFREHPADCSYVVRFSKRHFEVVTVDAAAPYKDQRVDIELDEQQAFSLR